jgi:hypothetical protein
VLEFVTQELHGNFSIGNAISATGGASRIVDPWIFEGNVKHGSRGSGIGMVIGSRAMQNAGIKQNTRALGQGSHDGFARLEQFVLCGRVIVHLIKQAM